VRALAYLAARAALAAEDGEPVSQLIAECCKREIVNTQERIQTKHKY